jgi:predicted Rossmann fold nucleotide-binding protein DprA/Smf involved in DNA uptake
MQAAVACEGSTVGVIAQNLERMMLEPGWRDGIVRRDLALISVDGPRMRAGPARSAARTPLLYALADHAVVVEAGRDRGETWAGVRALLETGTEMLFVRDAGGAAGAKGNRALVSHGVPVLPEEVLSEGLDLSLWFGEHARPVAPLPTEGRPDPGALRGDAQGRLGLEAPLPERRSSEATAPTGQASAGGGTQEPGPAPDDVFELVWPALAAQLTRPRTAATVARQLGLEAKQAGAWLERARKEGRVRRRGAPARYFIPGS